jgi:DNA-binding LacI/PurR family transcriptional regulator
MTIARSGNKAASLQDVASRAKIGLSTASTVLNGARSNTRVSEATRQRIFEAARELRYHPNAVARALAGRPTKTLGVLFALRRPTSGGRNAFASAVIEGIVDGAALDGYNTTLFADPWKDITSSIGPLRDGRIDGVIVIGATEDSDVLSTLSDFSIPAVSLSATIADSTIPVVDVDNEVGARLATEHLINMGHRRIAHLPGDSRLSNATVRRSAYSASLENAGIAYRPDYVPAGTYEESSGFTRTLALLDLPEPPTAIFAGSDDLAIAAIQAVRSRSLRVPSDVSIVGFDDIPMSKYFDPPLTTVQQRLSDIGIAASRLLIRILSGEGIPEGSLLFEPTLIVRNSTARVSQG